MVSDVERRSVRVVELEGVTNARDLGGIPVAGDRVVKCGLIYRGDALCKLSDSGRTKLKHEYGIRCVIDVRCGWEREAKPDVDIAGVENLHIPFYDLEKVGIEYTKSIEGSKAKFSWGVKNGRELEALVPPFRSQKDVSLVEGMEVFMPIYKVIGKIPFVRNISNKILVMKK